MKRLQTFRELTAAAALFTLAAAAPARAADETAKDWVQWRGPTATGAAAPESKPPVEWSEQKNIKWKVKIPGRGESTPIVVGNKIFIQTAVQVAAAKPAASATPDGAGTVQLAQQPPPRRGGGGGGRGGGAAPTEPYQFVLLCIDRGTGNVLWQKVAKQEIPHESGQHKDHGYSSFSPISDGTHIWAYFGSRGVHCFDLDGNLKWSKEFGKMQTRNGFGEGASPALHGDVIVVNWDHEGADFIVALDKKTGNELWRTPRDEATTWTTPLIVEHQGKAQVVVGATRMIRSYDLQTGKELWQCDGKMTGNVIPTPVADKDTVYVTSGFRAGAFVAIKLGKTGDLTGSDAIAWSLSKGTPYVSSPLLYNGRLYFFRFNDGFLTCADAKTGKLLIDAQRMDDLPGVYASPVAANGHVYLLSRTGTAVVMKDGEQPKEVATNQLDDQFHASPAIVGNEIFLRGFQSLYCIAEK